MCYIDYTLIPALLIYLVLFLLLLNVFVHSSPDLLVLEGKTREPILQLMAATIDGIVTIRAAGKTEQLTSQFHRLQVCCN